MTLDAPFAVPGSLRAGTGPTSPIIYHGTAAELNGGGSRGWIIELVPGGIPGVAGDALWLLLQEFAHQIKVVYCHVDQERLPGAIIDVGVARYIDIATEI